MASQKRARLPKNQKPLTAKQLRFVDEYLVDLNASAAAVRAGYSAKSSERLGHGLVNNPPVAAEIERRKQELSISTNVTVGAVLRELALIGMSNPDHYTVVDGRIRPADGIDPCVMRAVSSVKVRTTTFKDGDVRQDVEYRLWNKNDALKLIAQHVGACTPKADLNVKHSLYDLIVEAEEEESGEEDE